MISVMTVNFHMLTDLAGLAESLVAYRDNEELELIVANNSPGDPVRIPESALPLARLIERPNLGYARGINAAAAEARGDILFVANPDVRVTAGVLQGARQFMDAHPDVSILLPRLLSLDGRIQRSVRRFYTWPVAFYARCPLRDRIAHPRFFRDYLMLDDDLSKPTDVDWGLGAAMFLRRNQYTRGRIFDQRFFLYFEDVDLCMRAWRKGRRVVYHPDLVCEHRHRRQSAKAMTRFGLFHLIGMFRFVRKYGGFPKRPDAPRRLKSAEELFRVESALCQGQDASTGAESPAAAAVPTASGTEA